MTSFGLFSGPSSDLYTITQEFQFQYAYLLILLIIGHTYVLICSFLHALYAYVYFILH